MQPKLRNNKHLRGFWQAVCLLGLAAPLGCNSPTPPPIVAQESDWSPAPGINGIHLQTDHYDLYVTAKDDLLMAYLPTFLETAFVEYSKLAPPSNDAQKRMASYLFDNRGQWAAFTRRFSPARANVYLHIKAGGYMDHATATTVIWDLGRDRTLALLAHEGMHQYFAAHFPEPVAAWLNEGLATQWESFDLKGPYPTFTPRRNYHRTNGLREALTSDVGWIPLKQLLAMHAGQAVVQTGQTTRGYYAQVWALVLFMREGNDGAYSDKLVQLLADAGTQRLKITIKAYRAFTPEAGNIPDAEVMFRRYITEDLDGFEQEFRAFAEGLVS